VGDEALRKAQWNGKIGNDFPEHSVTNDTQTKSIIEPVQVPFKKPKHQFKKLVEIQWFKLKF